MKASEVYRRAAELIDGRQETNCWYHGYALGVAKGEGYYKLKDDFIERFYPVDDYGGQDVYEVRILALLLMSEIAKDEERKRKCRR